jgi:hypothetical protein
VTKVQTRILELFQSLGPEERREIAEQIYAASQGASFLERMSPTQKAELAESIAQADRGEGRPLEDFLREMELKYGVMRMS